MLSTLAAAFWPKPVIVRLSDFKSNEYRKLLGGELYEPMEENPMLGFRGAARYVAANFRDCFELECRAMKKVREELGYTNVELMVPFVRTVQEASEVVELAGEARSQARRKWPASDHDVRNPCPMRCWPKSSCNISTASPSAPTT